MAKIKLLIESQYIRMLLSPYLVGFNCILIIYGGLEA
jgi:hypothetical protein